MRKKFLLLLLLFFPFSFFAGPLEKALLEASKKCDAKRVRQLIRKGAKVMARDENALTALHYAAQINCVKVAIILLRNGADPNDQGTILPYAGKTPFEKLKEFYTAQGRTLTVDNLISASFYYGGLTPLHYAAIFDHLEVAKVLVRYGAKVNIKSNNTGFTPLHASALSTGKRVGSFLLSRGAKVNSKSYTGDTPLHCAATVGNYQMAELLIKAGADLNSKNEIGYTPLHTASFMCKVEVVKVLLRHKAELNLTDNNGSTPLALALAWEKIYKRLGRPFWAKGCSEIVSLLKAKGAITVNINQN